MSQTLNLKDLQAAYLSGTNNVYNYSQLIDKLNIFPVPDGDTGTNMMLTLTNTMKSLQDQDEEFTSITDFLNEFNDQVVMAARGNSGVILSQIFTGMHKFLIQSNLSEINSFYFQRALKFGKEYAYQAVMKPVEGTILTIIRCMADKPEAVSRLRPKSLIDFFDDLMKIAQTALDDTPNLLLILKETGVVDSGAYGLVTFFKGVHKYLQTNKIIPRKKTNSAKDEATLKDVKLRFEQKEYGYCTESIIELDPKIWNSQDSFIKIKNVLQEQGNTSIVTAKTDNLLKVHLHALQVGPVLTFLQQFGEFNKVKIENMTLQSRKHKLSFKGKLVFRNEFVIIPVLPTYELERYFNVNLNIPNSIIGGRLMNPTIEDFLKAFAEVDAKMILLLANHKNTILTAEKAAELEQHSKINVFKTTSFAETMNVIINYDQSKSFKKNLSQIRTILKNLKILNISQAEKNVNMGNVTCNIGDFVLINNHKIIYASDDFKTLIRKNLSQFISKHSELVTIFYSEKINPNHLHILKNVLDEEYDLEYEVIAAGDMIYQFIISIE